MNGSIHVSTRIMMLLLNYCVLLWIPLTNGTTDCFLHAYYCLSIACSHIYTSKITNQCMFISDMYTHCLIIYLFPLFYPMTKWNIYLNPSTPNPYFYTCPGCSTTCLCCRRYWRHQACHRPQCCAYRTRCCARSYHPPQYCCTHHTTATHHSCQISGPLHNCSRLCLGCHPCWAHSHIYPALLPFPPCVLLFLQCGSD